MEYREKHKRLLAAAKLLTEQTTSREKFSLIRNLIEGIHPGIDKLLAEADSHLSILEKIQGGELIQLTAEHLPEVTEEEKKRKRVILLFLDSWNKLKGEVVRVTQEFQNSQQSQSTGEKASHWGKIFSHAVGPLGIITIIAAGIVAFSYYTSVDITIYNQGCGTLEPMTSMSISLPGFSLPKDPIPSGGSVIASLPGLPLSIDGRNKNVVVIKLFAFKATFVLPSTIKDMTLDGTSLLGKESSVHLSGSEKHSLILVCK